MYMPHFKETTLKYSGLYFLGFSMLLLVVLALTVVSIYEGTYVKKADELKRTALSVAARVPIHEVAFLSGNASDEQNPFYNSIKNALIESVNATPKVMHASLIAVGADTSSILLTSVRKAENNFTPPGSPLPTYITQKHLESVQYSATAQLLGRVQSASGDVMIVAVPMTYASEVDASMLLVEFEARPFVRAVFLASLLPVLLLVLFYVLIAIVYFWFRDRERILIARQEFLALAARSMYMPLVGIGWATHALATEEKKPGVTKKVLMNEVTSTTNTLIELLKSIIDQSREERGFVVSRVLRKTTSNLTELVTGALLVHDLYARARNISVSIDKSFPDSIEVLVDVEKLSRAYMQVASHCISYAVAGETVHVAYKTTAAYHQVRFTASLPLATTPRGLLLADDVLREHGGMLSLETGKKSETLIILSLPRQK